MIVSVIKGGLGNQLFQYAIGRSLAVQQQVELKLDQSFFEDKGQTLRAYRLQYFNITSSFSTEADVEDILGVRWMRPIKRRFYKMGLDLFYWRYYREPYFGYHPDIMAKTAPVILEGYWQTEKYFANIRDILLPELSLKDEFISSHLKTMMSEIGGESSVSVHIRRGDYVNNPVVTAEFGVCSLAYYHEAMQYIADRVDNPVFYVFSDDMDWCMENLDTNHLTLRFISGNQDYEDLMLMSRCQHQIIANSSFSWWGAWLNTNPDKIVIAPKQWFASPTFDTSHVVPESWIKVDNAEL